MLQSSNVTVVGISNFILRAEYMKVCDKEHIMKDSHWKSISQYLQETLVKIFKYDVEERQFL